MKYVKYFAALTICLLAGLGFQNCGTQNSSLVSNVSQSINETVIIAEDFEGDVSELKFRVGAGDATKFVPSSIAAYSGNSGMRLDNMTMHSDGVSSIKLEVHKKYRLSFWARRVNFGPNDGIPGFETNGYGFVDVINPTWSLHELEFTAEDTKLNLQLDFYIIFPGNNVVDVDDIKLVRVD